MLGHQEMTTGGIFYYQPLQCPCCQLDTAGNHQWNCPCNPYSVGINDIIIRNGYPITYNFRSTVETIR
ncbi:hypothetical protein LCGC14_1220300 [marine sediment metagenome]|uniref:Uncharacterized protein n=1 Tax=marine sediment metagenome TaxID=412755 RepID=A0A0F9LBE8_9ZZZZ